VPQFKKQLIPNWSHLPHFKQSNAQFKQKQKEDFDKRHRVMEQSKIPDETQVVITTDKEPVEGCVVRPAESPRSYIVEMPSDEVRRNRNHLNVVPESITETFPEPENESTDPPRRIATRSQTGIAITPPDRLELT
jgi:hypothetical protein